MNTMELQRPNHSPSSSPDLIVITGGPGSGKSTLIQALAREGYATAPEEAGRAIIRDQAAIGGTALPWADARLFAELMLSWEMRSHREACARARGKAAVFFDRGVPDVIGYLKVTGLTVPPHMDAAARTIRYHRQVFIAPPWPAIYGQDAERKQTLEEARLTYEAMVETYSAYGYELIELPKVSVEERVRFVLDRMRSVMT
jgi:predicted ATPase